MEEAAWLAAGKVCEESRNSILLLQLSEASSPVVVAALEALLVVVVVALGAALVVAVVVAEGKVSSAWGRSIHPHLGLQI